MLFLKLQRKNWTSARSGLLVYLVSTLVLLHFIVSSTTCSCVVDAAKPVPTKTIQAEWLDWTHTHTRVTPRRSSHVTFHTGKRLFLFGGFAEEDAATSGDEPRRFVKNDLWVFQPTIGWMSVQDNDQQAGPRLVAAASSIGKKTFLLGGWDPESDPETGGRTLDTVHQLMERNWEELPAKLPGGFSRHVAVSLQKKGQILLHNYLCIDHVYLFDGKDFKKQPTKGTAPPSRVLHAATVLQDRYSLEDRYFLVFGGALQGQESQQLSNEVFVLDTKTYTWTKLSIDPKSPVPKPRVAPCLCKINDNCIILYGGATLEPANGNLEALGDVWVLHISDFSKGKATWRQLLDQGGPAPRNAATLDRIHVAGDTSNTQHFLLTGGWDPFVETRDDCFVLKVVTPDS